MGLIDRAGMLEHDEERPAGTSGEPHAELDSLDAWEFHDLLFHARSRRGRTDAPFGGTYRLADRMDPPSAVRPLPGGVAVPLYRPDLARLEDEDPPLAQWSSRADPRGSTTIGRSTRGSSASFSTGSPAFAASKRSSWRRRGAALRMAMASRPYPSGGALYELEFYAAVAACDGIEAGLHYYEPRGHALVPLHAPTAEVDGLLRDAAESAGIARESIQVLLIIAARVPRVSWKYSSMAYALVLRHVGVVFQNMYLAATAMGLAPCAAGGRRLRPVRTRRRHGLLRRVLRRRIPAGEPTGGGTPLKECAGSLDPGHAGPVICDDRGIVATPDGAVESSLGSERCRPGVGHEIPSFAQAGREFRGGRAGRGGAADRRADQGQDRVDRRDEAAGRDRRRGDQEARHGQPGPPGLRAPGKAGISRI